MSYDALVIAAHPDDAETQMGGTLAKLSEKGQRILLVDLTDGEPTEFAEAGVRARQAQEAAHILGVERLFFPHCKMEPPWGEFAFAVDVSAVYERKRQALVVYQSIFQAQGDRLLALYEAEDQYYGRMLGWPMQRFFAALHHCWWRTRPSFSRPFMGRQEEKDGGGPWLDWGILISRSAFL